MKCTRGRESRFFVCLQVFCPSRVISTVRLGGSMQFNLRTLLFLVLCIAAGSAWIDANRRARSAELDLLAAFDFHGDQSQLSSALKSKTGPKLNTVLFHRTMVDANFDDCGPFFLRPLSLDCFQRVIEIHMVLGATPESIDRLKGFRHLERVTLPTLLRLPGGHLNKQQIEYREAVNRFAREHPTIRVSHVIGGEDVLIDGQQSNEPDEPSDRFRLKVKGLSGKRADSSSSR